MLNTIANAVLPRLAEASTWYGIISGLGKVFAWAALSPEVAMHVSTILAAVDSLALIWFRQRESKATEAQS